MGAKPYMTSTEIIASIKRKIAFPIAQNTFEIDDILAFVNEEMTISQVPSILQFHEEFFTYAEEFALEPNKNKYPVPSRAIGMKLRNLFFKDMSNNMYEMCRVNADDAGFFQRNLGTDQSIHKYYFEGNEIVLTPTSIINPTGSLRMVYFIRPNQLVQNTRAAICQSFYKDITIDTTKIVSSASNVLGDTLTIGDYILTAGQDFAVDSISSIVTANNIVNAITTLTSYTANNGTTPSSTVSVKYSNVALNVAAYTFDADENPSTSTGIIISNEIGVEVDQIPTNFSLTSIYDFLETNGGHRLYKFDKTCTRLIGLVMYFAEGDVSTDFKVGDYICEQHECIIPQIPDDLHTGLAERTCARILASLGDAAGLAMSEKKIQEIELRQGNLLDNRDDGSAQKVLARHSLLRFNRNRFRRF